MTSITWRDYEASTQPGCTFSMVFHHFPWNSMENDAGKQRWSIRTDFPCFSSVHWQNMEKYPGKGWKKLPWWQIFLRSDFPSYGGKMSMLWWKTLEYSNIFHHINMETLELFPASYFPAYDGRFSMPCWKTLEYSNIFHGKPWNLFPASDTPV